MEPLLVKVVTPVRQSFVVKTSQLQPNEPWHYHSEYELILMEKGKGYMYLGPKVQRIEEGALILMGTNVPHASQKDLSYYEANPEEKTLELVVQFGEDLIGKDFFKVPEFTHINEMLDRSQDIIQYKGRTREIVADKIHELFDADPSTRIIQLLQILDILAKSTEGEVLLKNHIQQNVNAYHNQKLNSIIEYTIHQLTENITLADVASVASMGLSPFCRFFKKHMRKSYFEYLTGLRLSYVCNQLLQSDDPIGDIVFRSGFRNISNFNRHFKSIMGITPQQYRRQFAASGEKLSVTE